MNWKLIFLLSLFGLAMAVGTVFVITSQIEPWCWLVIFIVCAWAIAAQAPGKFFLHGFEDRMNVVRCPFWAAVMEVFGMRVVVGNRPLHYCDRK